MASKATLEKALKDPKVRKFLDLIAHTEGTEKHGYATAFGGGRLASITDHPRYLKSFRQKNGKMNKTSAAGRYQFLTDTWDNVARQYGLKDFGAHNQDLGAVALLIGRGALSHIQRGDWKTAVNKVGKEWASMPTAPASYSQPTRSWNAVAKFMGGKSTSPAIDYGAPAQDPRLTMPASALAKSLRTKGRKDEDIFVEILNSNSQAGAQLAARIDAGEDFSAVAKSVGLNVAPNAVADRSAPEAALDPRLTMAPQELVASMRDGTKSDDQLFVDILNSNSQAGAQLAARIDAGEDFSAVANSVGLNIPQGAIVDNQNTQAEYPQPMQNEPMQNEPMQADYAQPQNDVTPLMQKWLQDNAEPQNVTEQPLAAANSTQPQPQGLKPAMTSLAEILPDRGDDESYVDYMGRALGDYASNNRLQGARGTILQTNNALPTDGPIPLAQALNS